MRKLDVSAISVSNGMPVKGGIWELLQQSYQEAIAELGKSFFGNSYDATKVYILTGLVNSGSGTTYNISAGAVFSAGEVFLVDAVNLTVTGSNVPVATISTTYYTGANADPVQFTDGIDRNIHQIRKVVIAAGLSGSGISDYTSMVDLKYRPQGGIGQYTEWTLPDGVITDYKYFNILGVGIHPLTLGWKIDPDGGVFIIGYKAGDALFGIIGNNGGTREETLTIDQIPPSGNVWASSDSGTGSVDAGSGDAGPFGNGGGEAHNNLPPYKVRLKIYRVS